MALQHMVSPAINSMVGGFLLIHGHHGRNKVHAGVLRDYQHIHLGSKPLKSMR